MYKFTGDLRFKEYASRLARYFLSRLPEDGVVFYDFDDPEIPEVRKDTSAQAVAAAGLFGLAELCAGIERSSYFEWGVKLLEPLFLNYLLPSNGDGHPRGFLRGGCHFKARDQGVDSEIVYGDYYLVEALMRYLGVTTW